MIYRATPLESGFSPAELLLGRGIRTTLPQLKERDKMSFIEKDQRLKDRQKRNFDQRTRAKNLENLSTEDRVWVKTNGKDGEQGFVIGEAEEPDSYLVERKGVVIRRNRKHLTRLPEQEESVVPLETSNPEIEVDNSAEDIVAVEPGNTTSETPNLRTSRYGRTLRPNPKYQ